VVFLVDYSVVAVEFVVEDPVSDDDPVSEVAAVSVPVSCDPESELVLVSVDPVSDDEPVSPPVVDDCYAS